MAGLVGYFLVINIALPTVTIHFSKARPWTVSVTLRDEGVIVLGQGCFFLPVAEWLPGQPISYQDCEREDMMIGRDMI